jgi:probable F420-dependent oxidoreductase
VKFGIMFANTGFGSTGAGAAAIAEAAEGAGFEAIWTVEHVVVPSGYESKYPYDASGKMAGGAEDFDLPDPLVWLAYIAARTERIKLATGILILPQRNPVITAKELATIDHLSGGRMVLGVGAGWLAEEFSAIGVPFEERGRRLDEYVAAMRALWTQEKASFDGEFVQFSDCISRPRPAQGTIPVVVGGDSKAAARRAGRLGDGYFPGSSSIEQLRTVVGIMRESAEEHGRDPDSIQLIAGAMARPGADLDRRIEELAELGVTQAILPAYPAEVLATMGAEIVAKYA